MIEIKTLLSKTMLGSCMCIVLFQVIVNHHLLEQVSVHYPYCENIFYNWWYIMFWILGLQNILQNINFET
jgi:hypothetical protein